MLYVNKKHSRGRLLVVLQGESSKFIESILEPWIESSYCFGKIYENHTSGVEYTVIPNASRENNGEAFFISSDLFGARVSVFCDVDCKFFEIEDASLTASILQRLLYLPSDISEWMHSTTGLDKDHHLKHVHAEDVDYILISHLIIPDLHTFPDSEKFLWLVMLKALFYNKYVSIERLSTRYSRKNRLFFIVPSSQKRHLKIINKIFLSTQKHNREEFIDLVFQYVFSGCETGMNEKHIVRLCHQKKINEEMIRSHTQLAPYFSLVQLSKLKFLYNADELSETGSIASSVFYVFDNGCGYDKLKSLSPKSVISLEESMHTTQLGHTYGCYDFGRDEGAYFDTPYKADIPNVIKYIRTQNELDREGVEMAHCVENYGSACSSGLISIYKVFGEQRCTLAINNTSGHIIEMYGYGNERATLASKLLAKEWLNHEEPTSPPTHSLSKDAF